MSKRRCWTCEGDGEIDVCDSCFQRECWEGEFMCYDSRDAGSIEVDCPDCNSNKKDEE